MLKHPKIYFAIFAVAVSLGLLLSFFYRPYVYSNNVNDFGLADTIGSLVSVVAFFFLFWSMKHASKREKNIHIIFAVIIYSVVWELFGHIGLIGSFDWKDMVAAAISGIATYAIKEFTDRRYLLLNEQKKGDE